MSLFELVLIIILGVNTVVTLYLSISGRIINRKDRKEDLKRSDKSLEWEDQIKVLTKRLGELATEYHNAIEDNRKWKEMYNDLLVKYNFLKQVKSAAKDKEE